MGIVQALLLDFNGTLSDDETIVAGIYAAMFAELGRPLSPGEYVEQLAGLSDAEIFRTWLGVEANVDLLTGERVERYRSAVADGSTISDERRAAVRLAAEHVRVAVVTSAWRCELEPVLAASGLQEVIHATVCADDVESQKPDPEPYRLACAVLGVEPARAIAVEDTEAGLISAKEAGLRCAAVMSTMPARRLDRADLLLPGLNPVTVGYLLDL